MSTNRARPENILVATWLCSIAGSYADVDMTFSPGIITTVDCCDASGQHGNNQFISECVTSVKYEECVQQWSGTEAV